MKTARELAGDLKEQKPDTPTPSEGDIELGAKLAALRKRFGLNQVTVAEAVGFKRVGLAMIETGRAMPTVRTLVALAAFYETSLDDLTAHMRETPAPAEAEAGA